VNFKPCKCRHGPLEQRPLPDTEPVSPHAGPHGQTGIVHVIPRTLTLSVAVQQVPEGPAIP